jgi:hypothetical protein
MAGMHHALMLASRLLAGIVAGIASYFAFFLYEDEEGDWQNRIENLWASVHDRARVTDHTSTALFNRIGGILRRFFSVLYGKKLLSLQAAAVSVDISISGVFLIPALPSLLFGTTYKDRHDIWTFAFIGMSLLVCAIIPALFRRRFATAVACAPSMLLIIYYCVLLLSSARTEASLRIFVAASPAVFLLSILSDFFSVILLRKLFALITTSVSIAHIITSFLKLFGFIAIVSVLPLVIVIVIAYTHISSSWMGLIGVFSMILFFLNLTTLVLCALPLALLTALLLHKLIWPILSRLLYPVASRKLVTNRKALVLLASACVLYAANIPQDGLKDVLKLLPLER